RKSPADRVLHLAPYRGRGVTRNMVTCCKSTRDKYLMSYMSTLMAAEIERKLTPDSSAVLVPMPRSRQALLDNGFDQGKTIGRRIASALGIEYAEAIKHRGSKKQKLLGYRDRLRNAKDAFTLDEKHTETVRGKRVILYDDIITTGASAAVCVKLMREAGATGVDFVSFARTER
ncbi:MAG: ComF family protein, partial [Clostridia bacterium]|nr:ComF family protein [Clostridia bacterium]